MKDTLQERAHIMKDISGEGTDNERHSSGE
jgi:hypothetical protein